MESLAVGNLRQCIFYWILLLRRRGYSTAAGLRHAVSAGAFATLRVNTGSLPLGTPDWGPFDLLEAVQGMRRAGEVGRWPVAAVGRVCALRKTAEAIRLAHRGLRRQASKRGKRMQPRTLEFAKYVILITTFPAATVLEWYRTRWQVELVFKRFKSLAQLGHLPKHTDERAKA